MQLNHSNIVHYLLDKGHIDITSVVDGNIVLASEGVSRNRNYRVIAGNGADLMVKQVKTNSDDNIYTLGIEASCYWLANNDEDYRTMLSLLPPYIDYDPVSHILLLGLLKDADNLYKYYYVHKKFPIELGIQKAKILASFHKCPQSRIDSAKSTVLFQKKIPWIFDIETEEVYQRQIKNGADLEIVQLIKDNPEYGDLIRRAKAQWEVKSLIHGDIKWANFLIREIDREYKLDLIDLEIADMGDPCWDMAGTFQSYLGSWVFNEIPIKLMQPSIQAFCSTYAAESGYEEEEFQEKLIKSIGYTGVKIIQSCLESTFDATYLEAKTVQFLQLGLNMLKDPFGSKRDLLGLNN